jgi:hypothetical protein
MVYVVQSYWACFGLYPIRLRTETDPVSETLWYFLSSTYKTMDKVQNKPNSSVLIPGVRTRYKGRALIRPENLEFRSLCVREAHFRISCHTSQVGVSFYRLLFGTY